MLWVLILVLPWFVAIMARAGDSFFQESVGRICSPRCSRGRKPTARRPATISLLFWLTFWPAAPLAAIAAPAVWRQRREPRHRFLLAWLVPSWIVFELVVTKLPHYVLPLYPAIAILIALGIERRALSENPHLVRSNVMWPVFAAVLPAGAVIVLIYAARPVRLARLAVRGGVGDLRLLRLAALRRGGRGAVVRAREHRGAVHVYRRARRRGAADAPDLPEPRRSPS